jgi:hypothetical protein
VLAGLVRFGVTTRRNLYGSKAADISSDRWFMVRFTVKRCDEVAAIEGGERTSRRSDVTILDNWHVSGLRSTGSCDFEVRAAADEGGAVALVGHNIEATKAAHDLDRAAKRAPTFNIAASIIDKRIIIAAGTPEPILLPFRQREIL